MRLKSKISEIVASKLSGGQKKLGHSEFLTFVLIIRPLIVKIK
jgi:hypothetical protein